MIPAISPLNITTLNWALILYSKVGQQQYLFYANKNDK